MSWKRPSDIPFPNIWHRFQRKSSNGEIRNFYIQDATKDMHCFLIDYMVNNFIPNEPMGVAVDYINDEDSVNTNRALWKNVLKENLALVCFEEDPEYPGSPLNFVGCNMLTVVIKNQKNIKIRGVACEAVFDCMQYCYSLANKIRSDDIYMEAYGLSVPEAFQGLGIGSEILKARINICKAVKIPVSKTVFSNIASQKAAAKAGFKDLLEVSYGDLKKHDPRFDFTKNATKTLKIMYFDLNENGNVDVNNKVEK